MLLSWQWPWYDRRFVFFMVGVIAGELSKQAWFARISPRSWNIAALTFFTITVGYTLGGMAFGYIFDSFSSFSNWLNGYGWWLAPAFMLAVLATAFANGLTERFFTTRFLRFMGQISYSYYMLHIFIELIFRDLIGARSPLAFLTLQLLILAASTASHIAVERPAQRLAKRISRKLLP